MFTLGNYPQILLSKFGGLYTEADPRNLPPGASPLCYDVDFDIAGVNTRPGLTDPVTSFTPALSELPTTYVKSTSVLGPKNLTIVEDDGTTLYEENIDTAPGVFTSFYNPILNSARVLSETVNQREYMMMSDFSMGQDQPRQYDGVNVDRVSQVGPGAGPLVTVNSPSYPAKVTEIYGAVSIDSISWGTPINLFHAGGAYTVASNALYFLSTVASTTFTTGLEVGDIVYISGCPLLLGFNPNGTYTVNSIGTYSDTSGLRQYFGVTASIPNAEFVRGGAGGTYQKTQALVQLTADPIPIQNAVVGGSISIAGSTVTAWNRTWTIEQTPTVGQLGISATSLTSNVATYTYTLQSGVAPGWQPNFKYPQASQIVSPAGDVWQITVPGKSGGSIPGFAGATQVDGTATWTKQSGVEVVVTAFNTTNGNGVFNVHNAVITSATQTTFTVAITANDVSSAAEDGNAAAGSGTAFIIDPGKLTLSTGNPGTNPIYGNASNMGLNVLVSNSQVAAGQRYAVLMFLTRNGYITQASPPSVFFTTSETGTVQFSQLAIGPPNVIARIIGITLANAGPAGPYFWIPSPVILQGTASSLGITQTYDATILQDNLLTETGALSLSDVILASGINISESGNNLQQQRELAECVKVVIWAGRCFYLGERTKIDQFINLTFDGGTIEGLPAGWNIHPNIASYVSIIESGVFEQLLFINNTSGAVMNYTGTLLADIGSLYQGAYQTPALMSAIIQPNEAYSARIIASNYAGLASGSLIVELYSPSGIEIGLALTSVAPIANHNTVIYNGTITGGAANALVGQYVTITGMGHSGNNIVNALCIGSSATTLTLVNPNASSETQAGTATIANAWHYEVPMSSMGQNLKEFIGAIGNPLWQQVPTDLQLRVYPENLANNDNLTVYRLEIYPTNQPKYSTRIAASYAENPEAVDAVTGALDTSLLSSEALTNQYLFLNKLYLTSRNKHFSAIQDSTEPSSWDIVEIANNAGCLGPLASAIGEEYAVIADEHGAYIFDGGNHRKISQEIQKVWDSFYEPAKNTVWVLNDTANQRLLFGVPLPTPNQWLPEAEENLTPTVPNVILCCSYLGLMSGNEIADGHAVYPSAFTGMLLYHDMKRKWTIWQIPATIGALVARADGSLPNWFAGDFASGLAKLGGDQDFGLNIDALYTTYAYADSQDRERFKMGLGRVIFPYALANLEGQGSVTVTLYPETLASPYPFTQAPFELTTPALDDVNIPINETGNRAFVQLRSYQRGLASPVNNWQMKRIDMAMGDDPRMLVTGR